MDNSFNRTGLIITLGSLLAMLVVATIILASVPPVSRDALVHHLAVPKLYLKHGGIYEIPGAQFSYYPMNLDLLYAIPLYFGNDIIAKYMHFGFALLTAYLIWGHLRKRLDSRYALLGVLLFLSLPVIIKLSITAYVDLGLIFFSFAALIFFLKWINNDFELKYLLISAVWCGLCLGTKYNGMIVFFLLSLFIVFIYARSSAAAVKNQLKAIGLGAVFMGIALVLFSPWAIKNYVWTNNPIYPLYNHWFNIPKTEAVDISEAKALDLAVERSGAGIQKSGDGWGHFAIRKIIFKEKWWEISLIPIRIFFQGQDDSPKYFDGKLNPLLFFLPIFAFLNIKPESAKLKTEKKILLIFSILFILITLFQADMRIRYISPVIPPLVLLSIYGLKQLTVAIKNRFSVSSAKIFLGILYAIVFLLLGQNVAYIVDQFRKVEPVGFISGRIGRDEYIEKYRPEYATLNFANQKLPTDARILGVYLGNRSYYSERELIFDSSTYFWNPLNQKSSARKLLSHLQKAGITHMIIRYDLFENRVTHNYSDDQRRTLDFFLENYLKLLFSKGGYGLFELGSKNG
jgi:hypothetical protein